MQHGLLLFIILKFLATNLAAVVANEACPAPAGLAIRTNAIALFDFAAASAAF
jgi:hypothetical protein